MKSFIGSIIDGWKQFFSSENNFNLTTDPWIPVVDDKGNYKKISLMEFAVNGKKYTDFVGSAMEKVAFKDFLITCMQDALDGPKNSEEATLKEARKNAPEMLSKYFEKYRNKFNLYNKGAFLQADGVEKNDADKNITIMDCSLATGPKNSVHFDHDAINPETRDFSDDERARKLIVFQHISPHTKVPRFQWGDYEFEAFPTKASLSWYNRGMYVYIQKGNIFDTIFANLITKEDVKNMGMKWGVAPWRKFPQSYEDDEAIKNITETYLGRGILINRLFKLSKESNKITFTIPPWEYENYIHSAVPYRFDEKKAIWIECQFSPKTQIWRDIPSMLGYGNSINEKLKTPVAVSRYIARNQDFDIWVGGWESDTHKSVVNDELESVYHIPKKSNGSQGLFIDGIKNANAISGKLKTALTSCKKEKRDTRINVEKAELAFWNLVDQNRELLYKDATELQYRGKWKRFLEQTAKDVFMNTMKHIKINYEVQVEGYGFLLGMLNKE